MSRRLAYIHVAKPMTFVVDLGYETPDAIESDVDEAIRDLAFQHLGKFNDSGSGFGTRDMSFEFESREDARAFVKAARKQFGMRRRRPDPAWDTEPLGDED